MKKFTISLFVAMLAMVVCAQERPGRRFREFNPEEMAAMQTARIHQAVGLDSVQYQAIFLMNYADALTMQDSMKVRRERFEKMRTSGEKPKRMQPNDDQMKMRMEVEKQRREVRNERFKQILTPEQFEKFLKMEEQQVKRMREGGRRQGQPGRNRGAFGGGERGARDFE